MRSFIIKDLFLFWRDRKELITVLVLPILLVIVLNFAFKGIFDIDDGSSLDLQLAVVNQDNESRGMEQLKERLLDESNLKEDQAQEIIEQAKTVLPVSLLVEHLTSEELKDWITVHQLDMSEAVSKVDEGELDGILVIPDGFTEDSLYAAFVGESPSTTLTYKVAKGSNNNTVINNIVQSFLESLNYQFALQTFEAASVAEITLPEGGIEQIGAGESFTLSQYFTIAMSALFALFIAGTVATKAGQEIRQHVFNRIILSDSPPLQFLLGKMVSTFILTWLQIMFVFVLSHLMMDVFPGRSPLFWLGIVGIVSLLACSIAGLAAVFTSLMLKIKDIDIANGIFMIVIIVFGVIGGNFVPIYLLPNWLQQIGEWTPNGLSLVILTNWVQFEDISSIVVQCVMLASFFILCIVLSIGLYPRRGEA